LTQEARTTEEKIIDPKGLRGTELQGTRTNRRKFIEKGGGKGGHSDIEHRNDQKKKKFAQTNILELYSGSHNNKRGTSHSYNDQEIVRRLDIAAKLKGASI